MSNQTLHPYTEIINKKQKIESHTHKREALLWLKEKFPNAFDNTESIHPFKIGIMNDILKFADEALLSGISKSKLREAVVVYTRRLDYLTALKSQEMRIDLDGNPFSVVTESEAERAALKIKKRIDKSIKNTRKQQLQKTSPKTFREHLTGYHADQYNNPEPLKTPEVVIKNKSSRQFDPDMMNKLKEKLGLNRTKENV